MTDVQKTAQCRNWTGRSANLAAAGVWITEAARPIGITEHIARYWAPRLGIVFAPYPKHRASAPLPLPHIRARR